MAIDTVSKGVSATTTPQKVATLSEKTNRALLEIIRDNFNTQYATQATFLAGFRDAVSVHDAIEVDATLLADFRSHVPLSTYDWYKPFVDKFNARPCKEEDVVNLLSPGLPDFLAYSGGTSGGTPKVLPRYNHDLKQPPRPPSFVPSSKHLIASLLSTEYKDVKEIERAPGEVVQRIIVTLISGGCHLPGYAAPWAATVIKNPSSFLIIQALFFLASRDVIAFYAPYPTVLIDCIRHIDEQWDMLVSCIRDGTLPDLEGMDHVRNVTQALFHADPERAAELLEIGPPFSVEGWVTRVWPNVKYTSTVCSGQFATVVPKLRSILGPNVLLHGFGYNSSEAGVGVPFRNRLDEFVLQSDEIIEFLDVSRAETHENLRQAWEVEVGKQYEPILTTRDGLWRYRLGDILCILGFDDETNSPVFKFMGRKSSTIFLRYTQVTENQLVEAIQAFSSKDAIEVQEFTTVADYRGVVPTMGFFVELAGPLGPNTHQARGKLFDALATTNIDHQPALGLGRVSLPTIRIVKAGTFAEYRKFRAETGNMPLGQIKMPLVLVDQAVQEWILGKVVQEL
ncbi:GH3 auxin-responsive promoter [Lanmaoa asiatica]|nr:GH3 auxin-responsive promoter [Lanmaoa asiatica]